MTTARSSSAIRHVGERDLPVACGNERYPAMELEALQVLVTGAGGFIGGHLVERLVRDGRAGARASPLQLAQRARHARLARPAVARGGRGRARRAARRRVGRDARSTGVEVVFHLGAQIAIPYSYVNPRDFFEVNVARHAQRRAGRARRRRRARGAHLDQRGLRHAPRSCRSTEGHPLEPQSPYAASKIGADKLMDSFHRSYELAGDGRCGRSTPRPAPVGARGHPDDHHPGAAGGPRLSSARSIRAAT